MALGCKLSVLSLANLIDGVPEMLGDVELVEHDLGVGIWNEVSSTPICVGGFSARRANPRITARF
jgi:hypothetical protein